jgi:hypothetical protein
MKAERRGLRRWRTLAVLATGVAIGVAIAATPAASHIGSVTHLWNHHIKPKADARYVNASEAPWAVVESDGTLQRGSAVSAAQINTGQYEVVFNRNVRKCAYIGTLGKTDSVSNADAGQIGVVGRDGNVKGVWVQTFDSAGTATDADFHLVVLCGGGKVFAPPAPRSLARQGANGG